jgi:hypothetical protein
LVRLEVHRRLRVYWIARSSRAMTLWNGIEP